MAASLRVEPLTEGGFRLVGEVDLSNADELRALAPETDDGDLVLELSGLAFMDSTGLRGMIELARGLEPGGRLVLRNPSPAVDRLFEVTGIDRIDNLSIERS
jgi:anti-sigma B factor antagonist